jgi:hypothetical protein
MQLKGAVTPALHLANPYQRPEIALLLACCHTKIDTTRRDFIQDLLQLSLDWPYLLERAEHHSLMPLLAWHLQDLDASAIPTEVVAQIQSSFTENFQHNMRLLVELLKLVRLFETQNIPLLAFKGPVLAQSAYGNLALRQFLDLDILVPESHVTQASQLLSACHYQPQFTLTAKQQLTYADLRNEHSFWHEEKQISVDLHWSVLPKYYSFTPDPKLLWQSSSQVFFAEQPIPTLSPECLLLFLCAHGAKHNWSRLYWICDIAEVLRTYRTLDWQTIQALSGQFGTQRMLLLGLYLAHDLLGASLPPTVLSQIQCDPTIPTLAAEVRENLFQLHPEPSLDRKDRIYRQTMRSARDRVWYWIDTVFTPTPLEWEIVALPKSLFPLYYIIRMARLALKYVMPERSPGH